VVGEGEAPDEAACGVAVEEFDAAAADLISKGSEMPWLATLDDRPEVVCTSLQALIYRPKIRIVTANHKHFDAARLSSLRRHWYDIRKQQR